MSLLRAVHKKVGMFLTGVLLIGSFGAAGAPLEVSAAPNLKGPKDPQEVEQFIDAFFANPEIKENMAGASVVIVRGDDVLMKKGYGYADLEKKRPVNPDQTVFRIASVSKVFTSSAVMQLVEQGKIDLNEDLSAYLGEVRIPNHTDAPLTMKHLLTNSTGFEYGDTSELKTTDLEKEIPLQQFVIDNAPTVIRKPGEYYRYDNVGFTIQGYVVEHVSGQPFGAYIKDHIYEPLGMTNSSFSLTPSIMKHLAVPYNVLGEPIPTYATVPTELPAGGMLSTPADMAKFMMAFLNGGKLGAKRILSEESVSEMLKPQFGIHPRLPNMGYGFEYSYRQAYNGYYVIEKGGDVDGYHSNMWLLPNEDVGIFLIFNKDHDIRLPFFEAFMNHYYPAAQTAPTFLHPSKTTLEKFEGAYKDLRNNMWTTHIEAADGKLIVKDPLGEHTLRQIEPLLFQDENGFKAGFKLDDNQQVQAFYYDMKMDSWSKKLSNPAPYSDIDHDHPYASYIYHLRQLDVYDDEGETLFQPEQPITRAQFVGWFIRWAGIAPSNKTPVFNDVSDSDYAKEIQAAYDFGIIKGSEDGKFYPQKIITRQEAALIVWRLASNYLYAKPLEAELKGETDEWALEGVRYVVAKSLYGPEIENTDSGAVDYQSKQPLLKQEAAALLSAFADNLY